MLKKWLDGFKKRRKLIGEMDRLSVESVRLEVRIQRLHCTLLKAELFENRRRRRMRQMLEERKCLEST